jgi:hypothetical protein
MVNPLYYYTIFEKRKGPRVPRGPLREGRYPLFFRFITHRLDNGLEELVRDVA